MIWLYTAPLWSPFALLVLYFIGIQYERGGAWRACWVIAAPALVFDALLAHTVFPFYVMDYPRRGEWTFSTHLARLCKREDWRGNVARYLKRVLDAIAPSGIHIKPG